MAAIPNRNLPPDAQDWGRWVEDNLKTVVADVGRVRQENTNAFKGVNSALGAIGRQLEALNEITTELAEQSATLIAQQATLTEQQASLTTAFEELSDLSANQVSGATATNGTSSAVSISAGNSYYGATVVVPSGFTRAVCTVNCYIVIGGSQPLATVQGRINSSFGGVTPIYSGSAGDAFGTGGVTHAVTLTGLSGGDTVTGYCHIDGTVNVSSAYIRNAISVMFLK